MGSPQNPTKEQIATLEASGKLKQTTSESLKIASGKAEINVLLERQAVALVCVETESKETSETTKT